MPAAPPEIHLGTCAWSHADWLGSFYPPQLPKPQWLSHYAKFFTVVEVDATFYHTPRPEVVEGWLRKTPPEFLFCCKLPKAITHEAKLRDCETELTAFLEVAERFGDRLGCLLVQLPPSFSIERDEESLTHFVLQLPRNFRFSIEFRHDGWHLPRIAHLLENHGVGWTWTDNATLADQNVAPFSFLPVTSDVLYLRLMGDSATKYAPDGSGMHHYDRLQWPREEALESWALKLEKHRNELSKIFVFANDHFEGFAPLTCQRLGRLLDVELELPDLDDPQLDLL